MTTRGDHKGDTWDHVAIDAESRLVLCVVPGERTAENVVSVVEDVKRRTGGRLMDLITTDGYSAYESAILGAVTLAKAADRSYPRHCVAGTVRLTAWLKCPTPHRPPAIVS